LFVLFLSRDRQEADAQLFMTLCSACFGRKDTGWPCVALLPPTDRSAFHDAALKEIPDELVASSRNRHNPCGGRRKLSRFPRRTACYSPPPRIDICKTMKILK
jgi:hypothetical protein